MKNAPRSERKKYKKPEISRFPLRAEEAVLGFCKSTTGGGGPSGSKCQNIGKCSAVGS